ncbi:MAG: MGMT family protein [Muribaculaceae bacterium]|nr:MGMT family protein [Muribaculaceae bacterium]
MDKPLETIPYPLGPVHEKSLPVPSPWGTLELVIYNDFIIRCRFIDDIKSPFKQFHLPANMKLVRPIPSDFEKAVNKAVMSTQPGELISYGEVAVAAGWSKGAAQAVGNQMAWNSFALIVPCHRVATASGIAKNYRWGRARRRSILSHERKGGPDLFVFDLPPLPESE